MRIAVIGAGGQLGTDLCRALSQFYVIPKVHVRDAGVAQLVCLECPSDRVAGQVFNVVQENYLILDLAGQVIDALRSHLLSPRGRHLRRWKTADSPISTTRSTTTCRG